MTDSTYRVIGSKIQVAGWTTAACLLWSLKLCVAFFYLRLTVSWHTTPVSNKLLITLSSQSGLQKYRTRIYTAIISILTTFIAIILTIYLSCRPFPHYWQINPGPGNSCQAAVSKPILWVSFVFNVSTDVYLLMIPIPMLWKSSLKTYKKVAATMVLSAGMLVVVCATLKSIYVIVVSRRTTPNDSGVDFEADGSCVCLGPHPRRRTSSLMGHTRNLRRNHNHRPAHDLPVAENLARALPPQHPRLQQRQKLQVSWERVCYHRWGHQWRISEESDDGAPE